MCESSRLIAWIDGELPVEDAAAVSRHLVECQDCREQAERFREVSRLFSEHVHISPLRPARALHTAWLLIPAAIAAGVVMALMLPARHPVAAPNKGLHPLTTSPALAPAAVSTPAKAPVAARIARNVRRGPAAWQPMPPTVQIMIPADALFPPGAVPPGFDFVADLSLSPDGSAAGLALRP